MPSDGDSESGSSIALKLNQSASTSKRQQQSEEAPPGYVQSMINKIISNVTIVCNNLILKYVEDDIVLSLNVRSLRATSADELWQAAFTELSLPHLVLRKLVKVTDLTICLDRRNASGKIDHYQEPLLYRCSLEVHVAWCYDSINSKIPTISRYEVKCPKLDFSLTDTQVPMFLRIASLALALYYGQISKKKEKKKKDPDKELGSQEEQAEDAMSSSLDASWSDWAWSMGSSLLPIYIETDDTEVPKIDFKREIVFHAGVYVESATLVLKLTELMNDRSLFGSTKQCFSPFLKIDCAGIFQELIIKGMGAVNVCGGVSEILVRPMGICPCGTRDVALQKKPQVETSYVTSGKESSKEYIKDSLFPKDFGHENDESLPVERRRLYNVNWDEHLEITSEEKMLIRSPAFAMDYIYVLEIPDDYSSEQLSEVGCDLEHSGLTERALCRFVFGPCKVNVCSGLFHRGSMLAKAAAQYDYPPYQLPVDPSAEEKKVLLSQDEIDSLGHGIPLRVYQITAINPCLNIFYADHCESSMEDRSKALLVKQDVKRLEDIPALCLKLECLDAQLTQPMYSKLAVLAATQAKEPPNLLVQNCHLNIMAKFVNLSGHLALNKQSCTILLPGDLNIGFKQLMHPDIWEGHNQVVKGFSCELSVLKMKFTRPQFLTLREILLSYAKPTSALEVQALLSSSLLEDALTKKFETLTVQITGFKSLYDIAENAQIVQVHVENMSVTVSTCKADSTEVETLPLLSCHLSEASNPVWQSRSPMKSSPGRAQTNVKMSKMEFLPLKQESLVNLMVQLPINLQHQDQLSLIVGHVAEVQVCIDPLLYKWFLYRAANLVSVKRSESVVEKPHPVMSQVSFNSTSSFLLDQSMQARGNSKSKDTRSRRSGTSEKDTSVSVKNDSVRDSTAASGLAKYFRECFQTINSMLVQLKMGGMEIFCPTQSLINFASKTVIDTVKKSQCQEGSSYHTILGASLPAVKVENLSHKPHIQQFLQVLPVEIPESVWSTRRDNLPWNLTLSNFSLFEQKDQKRYLLDPITTNCTLSVTVKQMKAPSATSGEAEPHVSAALCIHADMNPVKINIWDTQLITLMKIIQEFVQKLALSQAPKKTDSNRKADINRPELGMGPNFVRPLCDVASDTVPSQLSEVFKTSDDMERAFSIWVQWTLPQITASLMTHDCENSLDSLLNLNMEDTQVSFDWTPIYMKVKARVSTAKVTSKMKMNQHETWVAGDNKGIILTCFDDLSHELHVANSKTNDIIDMLHHSKNFETDTGLLNLTFTRAECQSVSKKWENLADKVQTDKPDNGEMFQRYVSEVDIRLAPVDLLISPKDLSPHLRVIRELECIKSTPAVQTPKKNDDGLLGQDWNNNTIPLLHVNAKTMRLFLVSSLPSNMSHNRLKPDYLLCQIEALEISPRVKNPLIRAPLRPDLYTMATSRLSVPGSEIEDRQYEANVTGFGVYSGKWQDLLMKSEKTKSNMTTMGENPAFEWNTDQMNIQADSQAVLFPLLDRFDVQLIFAPAIVLANKTGKSGDDTLIAGHMADINVTNDVAAFLSINQLEFCNHFVSEMTECVNMLSPRAEGDATEKQDIRVKEGVVKKDAPISDKRSTSITKSVTPVELFVTTSNISVMFFQLRESERQVSKNVKDSIEEDEEESHGTFAESPGNLREDSPDSPKSETCLLPLAHVNILQPHLFLVISRDKQKMDLSVYDASISCSLPEHIIDDIQKRLPAMDDYKVPLFQTKHGDPDPKLGIPPALMTFTLSLRPFGISCKIERPVRFLLQDEIIQQLDKISSVLQQTCPATKSSVTESCPAPHDASLSRQNNSSTETLRQKLGSWSSLSLDTRQIIFDYSATLNNSKPASNVLASCGMMKFALVMNLSSKKDQFALKKLDQIESQISAKGLTAAVSLSGIKNTVVTPWNVAVDFRLSWLDYFDQIPCIQISVNSEELTANLGPNCVLALKALQDELTSKFMREKQESTDGGEHFSTSEKPTEMQEQHYKDDLRAGAFQYMAEDSTDEPKAYQIVFNNKPAAMTWRYPQPRALTRVTVFPVPLMAAVDQFSGESSAEEATCALQYWDSCLKCFQTYSDFKLSETTINHLNIPTVSDRNKLALAEIWRVVLFDGLEESDGFTAMPSTQESNVIATPRSLVSAIRVDSYFNSNLIPSLKLALRSPRFQLDIRNQYHFTGRRLTGDLKQFLLGSAFPNDQKALNVIVDNLSVGFDQWHSNDQEIRTNIRMKASAKAEFTDYTFLANHTFLEASKVQANVNNIFRAEKKENLLDVQVISKPISIKAGHFNAHALAVCESVWSTALREWKPTEDTLCYLEKPMPLPLPAAYAICNNTPRAIRFGQADTDENILLRPQECHLYAWRSPRARLLLRLCVEGGFWKWCEPFPLSAESNIIRHVQNDDSPAPVVIGCTKLTSTLRKVRL